jgi:hypothetical protein
MVFQNPPRRNRMLFLPAGVEGSMTYQPQVPLEDAQPDSRSRKTSGRRLLAITCLPF